MRSAPRVALAALALACAAQSRAWAQATDPGDEPPRVGVTLGASAGYVRRVRPQGDRDGLLAGVELLAHYRFVQAGVLVNFGAGPLGDSFTGVAGAVGARLLFGGVRFDALGLVGAHAYSGVGGHVAILGTSDPGADGTLTFLGARLGIAFEWGGSVRYGVGLFAFVDADLDRQTVAYQYTRSTCTILCTSSSPGTETVDRSATLGELQAGAMLRFNVVFGGAGP